MFDFCIFYVWVSPCISVAKFIYYRCNNYVVKRKTFRKNNSDIIVIWVCDWFKWANLFKISSLMSQFQPINEHYRCFVVFCLMFLITVDAQCQLFHSITTAHNIINSKQSFQSLPYPQVIKQFRCECL